VRVGARLLRRQEAHRLRDQALVGERVAWLVARVARGLGDSIVSSTISSATWMPSPRTS
jgi:hypothetical protein